MKEKVVEALRELGFILDEVEGIGYHFKFETVNMFYLNSDDEQFVSIIVPGILDVEEHDMELIYKTMDKVNSTLKYVKAYLWSESITLTYEREMFGEEKLEEMLGGMIVQLESALRFTRNVVEHLQNEMDNTDAGDEVDDDEDVEEPDVDDDSSLVEEDLKELLADIEGDLDEDADELDAGNATAGNTGEDSGSKDNDKA